MTKVVQRSDIEEHFKTKKGLHEFLTVECDLYLPPLEYTNSDWLRQIWKGEKNVLYHVKLTSILSI